MNVAASVNNYMIGALVKRAICGILICVIINLTKQIKFMKT